MCLQTTYMNRQHKQTKDKEKPPLEAPRRHQRQRGRGLVEKASGNVPTSAPTKQLDPSFTVFTSGKDI
jgi:hypothetical protein